MNPAVENGPATADLWPQPLQNAAMEGLAFACRVFWGPELEFCSTLHQGDGLAFLKEPSLTRILESSGAIADEIRATVGLYDNAEVLFQNLETAYVSLFISNRQGIAAPLYHSCYAGAEGPGSQAMLMGAPALEMKKRLASSGLALAEDLNQLPDHLCIEIEYLYFLLGEGWSGKGKERLTEGSTFAGDWMLPWVRQFQNQVRGAEKAGFYTQVSSLLVELLTVIGGGGMKS